MLPAILPILMVPQSMFGCGLVAIDLVVTKSGLRIAGYGCIVVHGWNGRSITLKWPFRYRSKSFAKNAMPFSHQSQMESAPFLGDDERLFWQRAEERNKATAELYWKLGLASYEAIEAFVEYKPVQ